MLFSCVFVLQHFTSSRNLVYVHDHTDEEHSKIANKSVWLNVILVLKDLKYFLSNNQQFHSRNEPRKTVLTESRSGERKRERKRTPNPRQQKYVSNIYNQITSFTFIELSISQDNNHNVKLPSEWKKEMDKEKDEIQWKKEKRQRRRKKSHRKWNVWWTLKSVI